MPNYELKADILTHNPEFVKAVKDEFTYCYLDSIWYDKNKRAEKEKYRDGLELSNALFNASRPLYDECVRIVNADSSRRKRLRKRIENMFTQGTCVFLTLTFADDVLNNTDAKTRRVYVARFLKSVSSQYVGNIDFGAENGREHYHAVVVSNTDDFSSWTYGFYKAITVRKDEADAKRLATYVSKLTNHAIKETTKRNALIYSR